jgi:hypothetical protein
MDGLKKAWTSNVATTSSRTRVNIIGAIELNTMTLTREFVETVNAARSIGFYAHEVQASAGGVA